MKEYRTVLCTAIVGVCVLWTAAAVSAADKDNFSGTWKMNPEKSAYSPGPALKSLMSQVQLVGDVANFMFDGYEADGHAILYEELSVKLDGKDYPVKDDPNRDTTAMRKINEYTLEQVNKKGGKVTTTTRTVYSPDGKTRTATTTGVDAQGRQVNNVVVFDRMK
jgi:hypothetical protein